MNKLFEVIDKKEVNSSERSIVAWGSRPVMDRDHERIHEKAKWKLDNFKLNPVLMLSHDYSRPPVGKVLWTKVTDEGLRFKAQFANTPIGNELFQLYKDGIMSSFSIGFVPMKWTEPEEYKSNEPRRTYTELELLEISCVSVPSCPLANLIEATEKGLIKTKDFTDYIEFMKIQESQDGKQEENTEETQTKETTAGTDSSTQEEEIVFELVSEKSEDNFCICDSFDGEEEDCKACGGKRKPKKEVKSISCTCPECGKTSESDAESCGMCSDCNVQMNASSEDDDDDKSKSTNELGYNITDEEIENLVTQFEKMLDFQPVQKEVEVSELVSIIESMNSVIEDLKSEIKELKSKTITVDENVEINTFTKNDIQPNKQKVEVAIEALKSLITEEETIVTDTFIQLENDEKVEKSFIEIEVKEVEQEEYEFDFDKALSIVEKSLDKVINTKYIDVDDLVYESLMKAKGKMFY